MRAVKGSLGHSPKVRWSASEGPRSGGLVRMGRAVEADSPSCQELKEGEKEAEDPIVLFKPRNFAAGVHLLTIPSALWLRRLLR